MYSPYSASYGLNSTTTLLLQRWLWNYITRKDWYTMKQGNQTKSIGYLVRIEFTKNGLLAKVQWVVTIMCRFHRSSFFFFCGIWLKNRTHLFFTFPHTFFNIIISFFPTNPILIFCCYFMTYYFSSFHNSFHFSCFVCKMFLKIFYIFKISFIFIKICFLFSFRIILNYFISSFFISPLSVSLFIWVLFAFFSSNF